MKKLYLFGNHKMNLTKDQLTTYLKNIRSLSKKTENVVGVGLSAPYLYMAQKFLKGSQVYYGPQNCHYLDKGAYTGEISVEMLKDFNCNMCIVGHSERRAYDNETNEKVNLKLMQLLKNNITPVFCFGETKDERDKNLTKKVIKKQLSEGLKEIHEDEIKKIIFAYEPVWAIGTGVSATAKQAEEVCKFVKEYLMKSYNLIESNIVLLYGGSLKPENAQEILTKTHIDGGLIGNACLKIDVFEKLINLKIEE